MKWNVKKQCYLFIFIWANLCYLCGQLLQQLLSVTGSVNAIEGSAESQLLNTLDQMKLFKILEQHNVITLLVIAAVSALITFAIVWKWGSKLLKTKWYVFLYAWTYAILFISYDQFDSFYKNYGFEGIDLSFFNRLIIFLMSLYAGAFLLRLSWEQKKVLQEYFSGKNAAFFAIVLAYITFACSGQRLFLSSQTVPWNINLITVSIFVLFAYWLVPFFLILLNFLETKRIKIVSTRTEEKPGKKKAAIFIGLVFIWGIYWLISYPAVITLDGVDAWREVMAGGTFTTAFPAVIKIVWRALYHIVPAVGFVSVLQILLLAGIVTAYMGFFMQKGLSFKRTALIAAVFAILPSTCLYVITHGSNIYYTICILWVTLYFIRFVDDKEYFKKNKCAWIGFGIAIAGTYLCRKEGFAVAIIIIAFLVLMTIRYKAYPVFAAILLAGILISTTNRMVYNSDVAYDDMQVSNQGGTDLLNDVTLATLYFHGNISEEDLNVIQKYADIEDVAAKYTDFPYDTTTSASLGKYMDDPEQVNKIAFHCISNNLDIAFRERLNKSECVWNVINAEGAYLDRCSRGIVENSLGLEARNTVLTRFVQTALYFPTFMFCVSDIFLYRAGIYVCILLVFALYWIKNHKSDRLCYLVPIAAHFVVMLLILLWSCSRHTWSINLMAAAVIIYSLFETKEVKNE